MHPRPTVGAALVAAGVVAEFFAPRLGGAPTAWSEANRAVVTSVLDPAAWEERLRAAVDYVSFDRAYQIAWLGGMCDLVGVPRLADDEAVARCDEASRYVWPRVRADFPGAVDAIRALRSRGYRLSTASGESSAMLAAYLDGMGVRDCFDRLYGPDLIETFKSGPAFYARLLADAGVAPANALIVDDSPKAIAWAAAAGARPVLVGTAPYPEATAVIGRLAELPGVLAGTGG